MNTTKSTSMLKSNFRNHESVNGGKSNGKHLSFGELKARRQRIEKQLMATREFLSWLVIVSGIVISIGLLTTQL